MSGAFEKISGHDTAKKTLMRAASGGRAAHAYLFFGPEGVGKKLTALAFAKTLNCPEKSAGSCRCSVCRRIDGGIFPDVSLFRYEQKQVITVENVREIERGIFLKPFEAAYKIFIIDGAERMNASAQNAFLKTLEEPPPYSVIILITHLPSVILPTIRSRCRAVFFGNPGAEVARKILRARGDFSESEIEATVKITGGSPGGCLKISPEEFRATTEIIKSLAEIDPKNPSAVFAVAESVLGKAKTGADQRAATENFADSLSLWMGDLIALKSGSGEIVYENLRETSASFASRISMKSLAEKTAALEDTVAGIKLSNLNCRLALENLFFIIGNTSALKNLCVQS